MDSFQDNTSSQQLHQKQLNLQLQDDLDALLQNTMPGQIQNDYLNQGIERNTQEQENDQHHQEELNAVIESISFGKSFNHKKVNFQAISAAISHHEQVRFVKTYLSNVNNTMHSKFPSAKNKLIAYRVNQINPLKQKTSLEEGFDDDGEPGAGEKLLGLLQKMEIENILIIVCIWNTGAQIGQHQLKGGELFRIIIERGRELLNTIHDQILQQEVDKKKLETQEQSKFDQNRKVALGTKIYSMGATEQAKNAVGLKGTNTFKSSMVNQRIMQSPGRNTDAANLMISNTQENNTDDENGSVGRQNQANHTQVGLRNAITSNSPTRNQPDEIELQIIKGFSEELTQEVLDEANREVEESLRNLTKANLMELKQFSKPHLLVEKTFQIVCALKGFKNFQWSTAKEMLGKPQFKMELIQTKPRNMRPQDVLKAQQILNQKTNATLTPQNVHLHSEGAALLLVWAANIIKLYACTKKLGDINIQNIAQTQPLNLNEIQRISARTKIMVKKDILQKKQDDQDQSIPLVNKETYQNQAVQQPSQLDQQQQQSRQQQMQINQKSGTIGHFLQNKQMVFSVEGNQLAPENKGQYQDSQQLVDLNVIKKGAFNQITNKSRIAQKHDDLILKQEEERMINEEQQNHSKHRGNSHQRKKDAGKTLNLTIGLTTSKNLNEDLHGVGGSNGNNSQDQNNPNGEDQELMTLQDNTQSKTLDDIPGRLKIHEVRELSDDVDDIIGKLKGVDYGIQDLDVLIELAKTLKHKRLSLFPDTSTILNSDNFGGFNNGSNSDNK